MRQMDARRIARFALPLGAALALAACGGEAEETAYETGVEDVGGGELIVTEENPEAVPVDTPDTPMTPVPEDAAPTAEVPPPAE